MKKEIAVLLSMLLLCVSAWSAQQVRIPGPGGTYPSGGSAPVLKKNVTIDSGTISPTPVLDLTQTVFGAGDLVVIAVTDAGSTLADVNASTASVCDSTTNATCIGSSLDSFTVIPPGSFGSNNSCSASGFTCSWLAYSCNVSANARYFQVVFNNSAHNVDETVSIFDFTHTGGPTCADAVGANTAATIGSTLVTSTFSTANASEAAVGIFADDSGDVTTTTAAATSPFITGVKASAANSMLGLPIYNTYSSTQTGISASVTTGNSAGHTNGTLAVATFK